MKKLFKEFKEFISRGNVIDLAVGVIIGGAFSAIITALTNNILRPLINWIIYLCGGGEGIAAYTFLVGSAADMDSAIYIDWGAFISAIINFLLIAIVLFAIIKAVNKANAGLAKIKKGFATLDKAEVKKLRKEGKSWAEIKAIDDANVEAQKAAEQAAAEEAAKNAPPTTEQLLAEIRDLLAKK